MKRIVAFAALILSACLSTPDAPTRQGGGSDTETLSGMVADGAGSPAAGVPVKLLPAAYDPSHPDSALIRRTRTDSAGRFRFEKVDTTRSWNVIAGDSERKAWVLAQGLRPGPAAVPLKLSLGKVFLISLHSPEYGAKDSGLAYFPGTDILARCNSTTASTVDSVPAEAVRFVIESRAGWKYDTTLVVPGDTAKVRADRSQFILLP